MNKATTIRLSPHQRAILTRYAKRNGLTINGAVIAILMAALTVSAKDDK